jgi:hypothetical protein
MEAATLAPGSHWVWPLAGISSIVYLLLAPVTLRHARGSAPTPSQMLLTAALGFAHVAQ